MKRKFCPPNDANQGYQQLGKTYSDNETLSISQVLIGQHLIFC